MVAGNLAMAVAVGSPETAVEVVMVVRVQNRRKMGVELVAAALPYAGQRRLVHRNRR